MLVRNQAYQIKALGQIQLLSIPEKIKQQALFSQHVEEVDSIWVKRYQNSNYFNGTFFNFSSIAKRGDKYLVKGTFVEYKYLVAHRNNPSLNLSLKPVGVSGLISLHYNDATYILFARRAAHVLDYPNCLELVPSGTIDISCLKTNNIVDYKSKLIEEFEEEASCPKTSISRVNEFAVVFDVEKQIYDICCEMNIHLSPALVTENFKASNEYQSPILIPLHELDFFCRDCAHEIVPTSLAFLEAYLAICLDIS